MTRTRNAGSTRTAAVTESMRARGRNWILTESAGERTTIERRTGCSVPVKRTSPSDKLSASENRLMLTGSGREYAIPSFA